MKRQQQPVFNFPATISLLAAATAGSLPAAFKGCQGNSLYISVTHSADALQCATSNQATPLLEVVRPCTLRLLATSRPPPKRPTGCRCIRYSTEWSLEVHLIITPYRVCTCIEALSADAADSDPITAKSKRRNSAGMMPACTAFTRLLPVSHCHTARVTLSHCSGCRAAAQFHLALDVDARAFFFMISSCSISYHSEPSYCLRTFSLLMMPLSSAASR